MMNLPFYFVRKFLKSRKENNFFSFVSIISISGIAIGVAILILSLTILNGFEDTIKSKIIDFNAHISITKFGDKNIFPSEIDTIKIRNLIGSDCESISFFLSKKGIIKHGNYSETVEIRGVDFSSKHSELKNFLVSSSKSNFRNGIFIGKSLAERLFININDKISIFSLRDDNLPSASNPPVIENLIASGIYESGFGNFDDMIVYVDLEYFQQILSLENAYSGLSVKLKDISDIDEISAKLQDEMGYPFYVRSFTKAYQHIFNWLELQQKPVPIILGLIILVASFNIVGTLLMKVLEQIRTIGILFSLGARKKLIRMIFVYQGFILAVIGILIGNGIAFILSEIQLRFNLIPLPQEIYFISAVPIEINPTLYVVVSIITLILTLIMSLIPGRVAAKAGTIKSIRFN